MSWRNASLVDINNTFEVDTSKLEERLDEIEAKLDQGQTIEDKVNEAIEGLEILDEEKVREIADEAVRDLAHSNEGEGWVQGIIDGNDYVTSEDVAQQIRDSDLPDENRVSALIDDAFDNSDFVDREGVLDILRDEGLESDSVADAEEVETLKRDMADLNRRFEMYASRVDTLLQASTQTNERVDALEKLEPSAVFTDLAQTVVNHNVAVNERMDRQERRLDILAERNATALDFFGLIQQAFNLLRRGA